MNLVDPRYFKQEAHVGEWVDAMLRIEGAIVSPLTMTVIADWMLETGETLEEVLAGSETDWSDRKAVLMCRLSLRDRSRPATDCCR
jgi:cardiolipin synthase A/B